MLDSLFLLSPLTKDGKIRVVIAVMISVIEAVIRKIIRRGCCEANGLIDFLDCSNLDGSLSSLQLLDNRLKKALVLGASSASLCKEWNASLNPATAESMDVNVTYKNDHGY